MMAIISRRWFFKARINKTFHPCLPRRSHEYRKYRFYSRLDEGRAALAVTPMVTKATIKDPNRTILDILCVLIAVLFHQGLRVKHRETTRSRNTASNTRYIFGFFITTNVSLGFATNIRWHKCCQLWLLRDWYEGGSSMKIHRVNLGHATLPHVICSSLTARLFLNG